MDRSLSILLSITLLLCLCGCSRTSISADQTVTMTYIRDGLDITRILTDEEAATVISILSGNKAHSPIFSGIPSCGFDESVSLTVGSHTYGIALDTCGTVYDFTVDRYMDLTDEEIRQIHAIFETYSGKFPCV